MLAGRLAHAEETAVRTARVRLRFGKEGSPVKLTENQLPGFMAGLRELFDVARLVDASAAEAGTCQRTADSSRARDDATRSGERAGVA